jgi:hypothetical protein
MSMFCNGDLDPDTKRAVCRDRGIKPPDLVKSEVRFWEYRLTQPSSPLKTGI